MTPCPHCRAARVEEAVQEALLKIGDRCLSRSSRKEVLDAIYVLAEQFGKQAKADGGPSCERHWKSA